MPPLPDVSPPNPPNPPNPPSRRFTDATDQPATVVGRQTRITGNLTVEGPLEVAGSLEGDCRASGLCRVRESGRLIGSLQAASIVAEGEVTGQLAAEKVEIGAAARVRANIRARVVAIAEGAFFEGDVHMEGRGEPAAPVTFKEKRTGEPGDNRPGPAG